MATNLVISYNDSITVDGSIIDWVDKGNAMPSLPSNTHYVIWTDAVGQNEIQTKDPATGDMTGNTDLNALTNAIGSTTVQALLDWVDTRQSQINSAKFDYGHALEQALTAWIDGGGSEEDFTSIKAPLAFDWTKTWRDYDEDYS